MEFEAAVSKLRGAINHFCFDPDNLQMPLSDFAMSAGVDHARLKSFVDVGTPLDPSELPGVFGLISELDEGEQYDVLEAKQRFLTPPRSVRDVVAEK
jgi:hypothetical protein